MVGESTLALSTAVCATPKQQIPSRKNYTQYISLSHFHVFTAARFNVDARCHYRTLCFVLWKLWISDLMLFFFNSPTRLCRLSHVSLAEFIFSGRTKSIWGSWYQQNECVYVTNYYSSNPWFSAIYMVISSFYSIRMSAHLPAISSLGKTWKHVLKTEREKKSFSEFSQTHSCTHDTHSENLVKNSSRQTKRQLSALKCDKNKFFHFSLARTLWSPSSGLWWYFQFS